MLRQWRSQSHVRWYCRYHVVIVPKYRRRQLYGATRKIIGELLKEICVSTIGLKEAQVIDYIRSQEKKDKEEQQKEMQYY